jgi:hypothetical protein
MILLIISCTKSCGLVVISPCHFHLHHMLLMPCLITLDHITLTTLVSLNFQNQTWAFTWLSRDDLLYEIGYQIPRTEPMHLLKGALTCKEWGGTMLKSEAFCWNYINVTTSLPFWLTSTKVWESSLGSCLQCLKALVWFWIIKPRD